ncbi:MAG: zinc ribbon domain-containing protein [Dehalococcoidia bacterium]|nr:zinc ribbon domain-containing protein [Dehalococcoidia bacterium]
MPIYEYECLKCGEHFEERRSMSGKDQEVRCPRCATPGPRRIFSTFGSRGACAPSSPT